MDSIKYIGLDAHQSTISVAVLNADGKLMMQPVIATHAFAISDPAKEKITALESFDERIV